MKVIKRFSKKKRAIYLQEDKNIEWMGDQICLAKKNYPHLELKQEPGEEDNTIMMASRQMKEGMFEVNGVVLYAETIIEAQRKYLRKKK